MNKASKIKYHLCECGRRVQLDGVKIPPHSAPGSILGKGLNCEQSGKAVLTPSMQNAKDERAEGLIANADKPKMVAIKCVYPPCQARVAVKAPPEGVAVGGVAHIQTLGGIPMCTKHGDILAFLVWFQIHVKMQPQQTASGLELPGSQNFQAILKDGVKP